jgi:hypothetical protein
VMISDKAGMSPSPNSYTTTSYAAPIHPMQSAKPEAAAAPYTPGAYTPTYAAPSESAPAYGTPSNTYNGAYGPGSAPLQIEEGNLDGQAKATIYKYDTDKDGTLNYNEALVAGKNGAFGPGFEKLRLGREELQGWFATVAGPSGNVSTREYAQTLVGIDTNRDGKITAQEASIQKKWAEAAAGNPGESNVRIYNQLVEEGSSVGLDKVLPKGAEQARAAQIEKDLNKPILDRYEDKPGYEKPPAYGTPGYEAPKTDKPKSETPVTEKPYTPTAPYTKSDQADMQDLVKQMCDMMNKYMPKAAEKPASTEKPYAATEPAKSYGTDKPAATDAAYQTGGITPKADKEKVMMDFMKGMMETMMHAFKGNYGTTKPYGETAKASEAYGAETSKAPMDYGTTDPKKDAAKADSKTTDYKTTGNNDMMMKLLPLFLMLLLKVVQMHGSEKGGYAK